MLRPCIFIWKTLNRVDETEREREREGEGERKRERDGARESPTPFIKSIEPVECIRPTE